MYTRQVRACVAVCCSVSQCVAVCAHVRLNIRTSGTCVRFNALQCDVMWFIVYTFTWVNIHTSGERSVSKCVAVCWCVLQCVAVCWCVSQYDATCWDVLQRVWKIIHVSAYTHVRRARSRLSVKPTPPPGYACVYVCVYVVCVQVYV